MGMHRSTWFIKSSSEIKPRANNGKLAPIWDLSWAKLSSLGQLDAGLRLSEIILGRRGPSQVNFGCDHGGTLLGKLILCQLQRYWDIVGPSCRTTRSQNRCDRKVRGVQIFR